MKTILLTILCFGCFFISAFAQSEYENDLFDKKLRGAVKKVENFYVVRESVNGKDKVSLKLDSSISFNKQGWMTEINSDLSSDYSSRMVFFHDYRGRRILSERFTKGNPSSEYSYEYDKSGRITRQTSFELMVRSDGKRMKFETHRIGFVYDNRRNLIEMNSYLSDDQKLYEQAIYTYDDQNRRISEKNYGFDGKLKSGSAWAYNSNGQLSEISGITDTVNYGKRIFEYDAQGRLLSSEDVLGENIPSEILKYTPVSKMIRDYVKLTESEQQYICGELFLTIVKKIDQYGNVLEKNQTYTDAAKKMLSQNSGSDMMQAGAIAISLGMFDREKFQYEYDAKGNWIKRTEYQANEFIIGGDNRNAELKPGITESRVITYYD